MKNRIPLAFILSLAVFAAQPVFAADSRDYEATPVEGGINGQSVFKMRVDVNKSILVAVLRKAKTWDEAHQIVADFSPQGEWRLPDGREHLSIILGEINPGIETGLREGGHDLITYVAWIRGDTQEETERFKGTSLAAAFVDGHGVTLEPFDLKEVYDYIRQILANEDAPKEEIAHVRRLESQIKDGLVVYAVKAQEE